MSGVGGSDSAPLTDFQMMQFNWRPGARSGREKSHCDDSSSTWGAGQVLFVQRYLRC